MQRLILLLLLTPQPFLFAQGVDIRGIVTDSASGERVAFANILIQELHRGAATNVNGFYIVANVARGSYEISASAIGYVKSVQQVHVRGNEPMIVNFRLTARVIEFSEITSEAKRATPQLDAASVHVVGPQELQSIPVPGQRDVLRSLTILPGIVSTADVSAKFYVRGGAGDQNLILLDGMRIYNPFHAFGVFSVFDPDIVSTTEVHTGAFPAGQGNRLSSVINMTTKQGNNTRLAGKAEVNFLAGKLQLEGPLSDDNSWLVSVRKSSFDQNLKHFLRNQPPTSFYDLFFKGTVGSATGRNSLRAFLSGDDITTDNPDEANYSWRNQSVALSLSGLAYDRIYVDGVAYSTRFKVSRDAKQSQVITPAESKVGDDGMRVDLTIHTETEGTFLTGFQFDLPEYEFTYVTKAKTTRTFKDIDSEIWMWFRHQYHFGAFRTDVGLHSDVLALFEGISMLHVFQPRINARYALSNLWAVRAGFGVFNQRVISISNEDDIISLFEAWIPIPNDTKPEEAHHYVIGLDGILSDRLTAGVQGYLKNFRSLVLYNRNKYLPSDPDYINGTGRAYGAELLVRYSAPLTELYLAYSYGWTRVTSGGLTYSPRYDRRHSVNALGVFHPIENLDVSLRWEFGTGYPFTQTEGYYDRLLLGTFGGDGSFVNDTGAPYSLLAEKNAARLPAYYRIDASVMYRFTFDKIRAMAGVSAANLTNRKNILFYDRKTGKQINMLDFFPSAMLKVEF